VAESGNEDLAESIEEIAEAVESGDADDVDIEEPLDGSPA
jgi:hypothetical protein